MICKPAWFPLLADAKRARQIRQVRLVYPPRQWGVLEMHAEAVLYHQNRWSPNQRQDDGNKPKNLDKTSLTFSVLRNSRSRFWAVCNSLFGKEGGGTKPGVPGVPVADKSRSNITPPWWSGIGTGPTDSVANNSATLSDVECEMPFEVGRTAVGRTTSTVFLGGTGSLTLPFC